MYLVYNHIHLYLRHYIHSSTIGTDSLRESYKNEKSELGKISLKWQPDFIDLALSDDLGYIYGYYIYTTNDWVGVKNVVTNVFHTVWKRQSDVKWKFEELYGCLIIIYNSIIPKMNVKIYSC